MDRLEAAAPNGIHAFIDTYGDGYVELAFALGVAPERIDTITDFAAAAKYGVKTEPGTKNRPAAEVLAELAGLIAAGHLAVPIANVYPLTQVRQAYTELERFTVARGYSASGLDSARPGSPVLAAGRRKWLHASAIHRSSNGGTRSLAHGFWSMSSGSSSDSMCSGSVSARQLVYRCW
ncbi:zinc-binding dehydrogenase [Nocardia sp. NPDC052112]|uniref:zinc-binding dehydrogenase n=1 Tax=Nocardia sp. NPDC052112 TaxID=3155646 RepID=UPI003426E55A